MKRKLSLALAVLLLVGVFNGMAFAEPVSAATVVIDSATYDNTSGQIKVSGRITANAENITEKGFTYSYTNPEPGYWGNYDGCKSTSGTVALNVPFTDTLSNIDSTKTVCYVRAYVVKPVGGDSHGEVIYSKTATVNILTKSPISAPATTVVIDSAIYSNTSGHIKASGRITANAENITEKGFMYSYTNPKPGYWGNYDGCKATSGTNALNVPFTDILSDIDPTKTVCYVRAYVIKPVGNDSHGEVIYSNPVTVNITATPTQQPINAYYSPNVTSIAKIDDVDLTPWQGTPLYIFKPSDTAKLIITSDTRLYNISIIKINDNTSPINLDTFATFDRTSDTTICKWDFGTASKFNAAEINLSDLNLPNGTYVINSTENFYSNGGSSGNWYPFIIDKNYNVPTQLPISTSYSQTAVTGAKFDNVVISTWNGNAGELLPVFNPKSGSKLTISTNMRDKRFWGIQIEKLNGSTSPVQSAESVFISGVGVFNEKICSWYFGLNSNYNVAEIKLSDLNLKNGTYRITGWDEFYADGGKAGERYEFIIDKSYIPPTTPRFSDVPQSHPAYSAIMQLVAKGVLTGYPDETFKPNNAVTRSAFAVMMTKALDIPLAANPQQTFTDVKKGAWDFISVETAKKYLTGYKQGNIYYFKGSENAVREDMAVALVMALGLENQPVDLSELKTTFKDYNEISPNLQKYVLIAHKNGLFNSVSGGAFGPQQPVTRAEAATLLMKVLDSNAIKKVKY